MSLSPLHDSTELHQQLVLGAAAVWCLWTRKSRTSKFCCFCSSLRPNLVIALEAGIVVLAESNQVSISFILAVVAVQEASEVEVWKRRHWIFCTRRSDWGGISFNVRSEPKVRRSVPWSLKVGTNYNWSGRWSIGWNLSGRELVSVHSKEWRVNWIIQANLESPCCISSKCSYVGVHQSKPPKSGTRASSHQSPQDHWKSL